MCLMAKCPALKPCNYKDHKASSTEVTDRLSGLPHDILLLVLSSFTAKEVARIRLVSKRWRMWLLRYYPKLNFENPTVMKKFRERTLSVLTYDVEFVSKERSAFVSCVDDALKEYLDASIDEFRVKFDLDDKSRSHIDKWVAFAFAKQVKRLDLDFANRCILSLEDSELHRYTLPLECCKPLGVNHALTSLCLKSVNVTSEVVDSLLHWCPFLEKLYIEESEFLTNISSSCSSLRLKHLDVSDCPRMSRIDILAPKMVFFRYSGCDAIELNIRDALSLSSLSIGGWEVLYAFEPLLQYFSQLEVLFLQASADWTVNEGVEHFHFQPFTKLKVLELCIEGSYSDNALCWTPLIEACINLEKLTLKFDCYNHGLPLWRDQRDGNPLKCLKTLELSGYRGYTVDFNIAIFILKNAIKLQEVIVDVGIPSNVKDNINPYECVMELREEIPHGVKFVLMNSDAIPGAIIDISIIG